MERLLAGQHRMLEHAGEPAGHDMRTAPIGLSECCEDRAVLLAAGKVDAADEPAEQPRGIDAGTAVDAVEGEARDRESAASILRLTHRAFQIAPERCARQKTGSGSSAPSLSTD